MASGCQATVRTCNDYSGGRCEVSVQGAGTTRYSIVTDYNYESSCIIALAVYVRVRFIMEQSKENAEIGRIILP